MISCHCHIIGCQSSRLRNSKKCFEHVKNPPAAPRARQGFRYGDAAGATSTTGGSIIFTTGSSPTTSTNIIWTDTSTSGTGWTTF